MKFLYIAQLFFDVDTSLVRFSALAFYGRIFHVRRNPSKVWRIAYYGTICLSVAWLVAQFLFDAFSCHPLSDFWAPRVLRPCVPPSTFFLVGSAGDFIANLLVLLLPLPQVLRLDLEWRKKISISLAFIFGYGYDRYGTLWKGLNELMDPFRAAFMSLGRLITTLEIGTDINEDVTCKRSNRRPYSISYSTAVLVVPLIYWYIAEVGLSIVAICLPAIFQLGRRGHRQGLHSLFHTEKSMFRTSNIMANGTDSRMDQETSRLWQPEWDWNNLYNGPSFDAYVTAGSTSGKEEPTTEGINVRKDVDIVMSNMR